MVLPRYLWLIKPPCPATQCLAAPACRCVSLFSLRVCAFVCIAGCGAGGCGRRMALSRGRCEGTLALPYYRVELAAFSPLCGLRFGVGCSSPAPGLAMHIPHAHAWRLGFTISRSYVTHYNVYN